jgi:hypothetical protein
MWILPWCYAFSFVKKSTVRAKKHIFCSSKKNPIDKYMKWPYWFWSPFLKALKAYFHHFFVHLNKILTDFVAHFWNSVFGLWGLIFTILPIKSIFILALYKIFDRYIHIPRSYWFWNPNSVFGLWWLIFPFWPPKVYIFFIYLKFPIDGYITRSYWYWSPNSVFGLWKLICLFILVIYTSDTSLGSGDLFWLFDPLKYITRSYWYWSPNSGFGLWGLIFALLTPKSIYFLYLFEIPDRWINHTIILILEPKLKLEFVGSEDFFFCLFDP